MPSTLTVGLTGGIASGKSLVASAFQRLGVTIVDADVVARDIVEPGQPALAEIAERFGADIVDDDCGFQAAPQINRELASVARVAYASELDAAQIEVVLQQQ